MHCARSLLYSVTQAAKEDDSPLIAQLHDLPPTARRGLIRAARTTSEAAWSIKGSIRQRNIGASEVLLTPQGAQRLQQSLSAAIERRTEETLTGFIDGFRRSLSTLYFQPQVGRIIQAAVLENATAAAISELFADKDSLVEVVFDVLETFLPGDESRPQKSRSVKLIRRAAAPHRQLTIDE